MSEVPIYKIVLVGAGGVGKSAFIERHLSGKFIKSYNSTSSTKESDLMFNTNYGPVKFKMLELPGQEKYSSHLDRYDGALGTIVMFGVDSSHSYKEVPYWSHDVWRTCGKIPTVICGNKVDIDGKRKVSSRQLSIDCHLAKNRGYPSTYYEISAKSNYNYEKPFLWLAQQLLGHDDLRFVETPIDFSCRL